MSDDENSEKFDATVGPLIVCYEKNLKRLKNFQHSILGYINNSDDLQLNIHSMKTRLKSANSLRDKLLRKVKNCHDKGIKFDITEENLLTKITDLIGFRLLHIHTQQFSAIDAILRQIIAEEELDLLEGPVARIWDVEYEAYFRNLGVLTEQNERMYTSVHYVVGSGSKFNTTCEIQVRTLTQEVWGEVDHEINYPHPIGSISCREQIKALARVTSGAGRLVDSIYATVEEVKAMNYNKK